MIYYRVAIKVDEGCTWKWRSTHLTSLDALFRFLRLYSALPQDRLRVFSSASRESMNELLAHENSGLGSHSVTAEQFLHERKIYVQETTLGVSVSVTRKLQEAGSIAVTTRPSSNGNMGEQIPYERSISSLERRRLELEGGAGGDHDLPYTFVLPHSVPQVLVWMRLLAKVQCGKLEL